ncbi:MAG TPA: DUF1611 domain-containing protein [Rhodobacteraceae bacterium]|nr:DUF1611 domain-containing protein [Paracoccaceae bacterium]
MTFQTPTNSLAVRNMLEQAKWAFATRRVDHSDACGLSQNFKDAIAGDLVLGRVTSISSHKRIQLPSGRPSRLYPDDLVVLAVGARYAADQFEGYAEIDANGADMLAGGGCIGRMVARNERVKAPTRIEPLGLLKNADERIINLADYALTDVQDHATIPVICIVGSGMNGGKTTATAALIYGLRQAGWNVAGLKGTGTGAFGDYNAYADAGAHYVGDFTDTGMVTTYLEPKSRIVTTIDRLLVESEARGCDIAVLEIADGVLQKETIELLQDPSVRGRMSGFIYACGDALSAAGGVHALRGHGIEPAAITGIVSCSPMATTEAVNATGIEVVTRQGLSDPAIASSLFNAMRATRLGEMVA